MNIQEIATELSVFKCVGVGESSHGTHEFFKFKSELFQELVVSHGFTELYLEDSVTVCHEINNFISTGIGEIDLLMHKLYSVWQTEELKQLILWMRQNYEKYSARLYGFDINQTPITILQRDQLMAKKIIRNFKPGSRAFIWAHNYHIQKYDSGEDNKPMGIFLKEHFKNNYVSVGQFFGTGVISATKLVKDAPANDNRTLSRIVVDILPNNFFESILDKYIQSPIFISKSEVQNLAHNLKLPCRSIGWGLVPELANKMSEVIDLNSAFDYVTYFKVCTPSQPLNL